MSRLFKAKTARRQARNDTLTVDISDIFKSNFSHFLRTPFAKVDSPPLLY